MNTLPRQKCWKVKHDLHGDTFSSQLSAGHDLEISNNQAMIFCSANFLTLSGGGAWNLIHLCEPLLGIDPSTEQLFIRESQCCHCCYSADNKEANYPLQSTHLQKCGRCVCKACPIPTPQLSPFSWITHRPPGLLGKKLTATVEEKNILQTCLSPPFTLPWKFISNLFLLQDRISSM